MAVVEQQEVIDVPVVIDDSLDWRDVLHLLNDLLAHEVLMPAEYARIKARIARKFSDQLMDALIQ